MRSDHSAERLVRAEHDAHRVGTVCEKRSELTGIGGGRQRELIGVKVLLGADRAALGRSEFRAHGYRVESERGVLRPRLERLLQQRQCRNQDQHGARLTLEQLGHRVHAGQRLAGATRHDELLAAEVSTDRLHGGPLVGTKLIRHCLSSGRGRNLRGARTLCQIAHGCGIDSWENIVRHGYGGPSTLRVISILESSRRFKLPAPSTNSS
jgi:hypothetical protein